MGERSVRRRRWPLRTAIVVGVAGSVSTAGVFAGAQAAVVAVAASAVALTTWRLASEHRLVQATLREQRAVARGCAALASQTRIGRVPGDALLAAASGSAVLRHAVSVQRIGGDVAESWRQQSELPGQAGLLDLARAWEVSAQTGAPLARPLEQVAEGLAADQGVRAVVAGELAAPRATGKIMAVLPLGGLAMGYLLGGDPIGFLLKGPLGWLCLVAGCLMACGGVLWVDALARRAVEER